MSVGGNIVSKIVKILDESKQEVVCYTCKDSDGDLVCVYGARQTNEPRVGEKIWWQGRVIYFNNDKQRLVKVGYSFDPEDVEEKATMQ